MTMLTTARIRFDIATLFFCPFLPNPVRRALSGLGRSRSGKNPELDRENVLAVLGD